MRNLYSNEGCFNLNLWMYSLVETWAWDRPEEELVDRSRSPWDSEPRRPSHQDKRKALQREVVAGGNRGGSVRAADQGGLPRPGPAAARVGRLTAAVARKAALV